MRDLALAFCALLAFLIPVAMYSFVLATINRRPRPLMVDGVWDAVGLAFAVSGFFLVTVPMLLAELYLRVWMAEVGASIVNVWLQQWILWLVYFLLLISGAALMINWRTHKTVVYNVDPEQVPRALERTLAALGLSVSAYKERLVVAPALRAASAEDTAFSAALTPPAPDPDDHRRATLQIESFPSMSNVTLHWNDYTPATRRQIEAELDKFLDGAAPLENPAAGWFLTISGMVFGTLLTIVLTVVAVMFLSGK
jgi:hypothetical protein